MQLLTGEVIASVPKLEYDIQRTTYLAHDSFANSCIQSIMTHSISYLNHSCFQKFHWALLGWCRIGELFKEKWKVGVEQELINQGDKMHGDLGRVEVVNEMMYMTHIFSRLGKLTQICLIQCWSLTSQQQCSNEKGLFVSKSFWNITHGWVICPGQMLLIHVGSLPAKVFACCGVQSDVIYWTGLFLWWRFIWQHTETPKQGCLNGELWAFMTFFSAGDTNTHTHYKYKVKLQCAQICDRQNTAHAVRSRTIAQRQYNGQSPLSPCVFYSWPHDPEV